ncbi:MAG TPA: glycosyltransferase family 2 protein [Candidatus Microsaccharimonas sp.]|nr:glycosyltransferase family 2 protein [Candidatus Microsaccharimonas sp.]
MTLMLWLFGLLSIIELCIIAPGIWHVRRPVAAGTAIGLALVSGGIVGIRFSLATCVFALISLYRVIGLLRLVQNRTEKHYLRRAVGRTTRTLLTVQLMLLGLLWLSDRLQPKPDISWLVLSALQALVALVLLVSTQRQLRKTLPLAVNEHFSDEHLPSLSVCIPARNETESLEECLRTLTGSNYPKLEILVLDDCSQGPRTSDIIRAFAHDGVRFIQGTPPPDGWLAKNWGYQQLYEASSGALVLFCGVDIRFEPQALRTLVTTLLAKDKRMACVIPRNIRPTSIREKLALLIQPARYAWELCPPRQLFNRPPVLSSCWVAERSLLAKNGSFAAVRGTITPEAHFARKAIALRDGYTFVQSAGELAVTSLKSRADQWDTAVRTRYPQLRKRPEMVLAVCVLELLVLVGPIPMLAVAIINGLWIQTMLAGLAAGMGCVVYAEVVGVAYRSHKLLDPLLLPFAVLINVYIRHESMWRYEFGEVTWKGRNVCMPVMRVIPRLPKIN